MLTNLDLIELSELRRALHKRPEVSGKERETAQTIMTALEALSPNIILSDLGGHGVAAVFEGEREGPTVMFRAELDALPIQELGDIPWMSQRLGTGHLCGHDGHMTMLLALGRLIARQPVASGRVVLMFQPAEEDGSGARAVVSDPAFSDIAPDWAFAIHNEPGRPLGEVGIRAGLINCASQGLEIRLTGKTAHAANPETGTSPARAVSNLITALTELGTGGPLNDAFKLVSITHIRVGEPSFGISPGEAVIYATLRTANDAAMAAIAEDARKLAAKAAEEEGLEVAFFVRDDFAASVNDPDAVGIAASAMDAVGIAVSDDGLPMRASEDFGVFGWNAKAAMMLLGSGEGHAALHNPDYDFLDDLIPIGAAIFDRIARDVLGTA